MPEVDVPVDSQTPVEQTGMIVRALAISSAAISYVIASVLYVKSTADVFIWIGPVLLVILGLAAVRSYVGLVKMYPAAAPASFGAIGAFLADRPRSKRVQMCRGVMVWGSQLCYWILPCLWIAFATNIAAYIITQIWPQVPCDSPWVIILLAVILGFGLSYIRLRRVRVIVVLGFVIGIVQFSIAGFFILYFLAHRASATEGTPAWTLDSSNTPTQYVQDFVPKILEDARHPGTQIPDPEGATIPKTDPSGNPVWVYNAVDASGNLLRDGAGNPIIVPTDANGKLAPLPSGAAKAVPESNTISVDHLVDDRDGNSQYQYHHNARSLIEDESTARLAAQRFPIVVSCVALGSMALFQLIASLGQDSKRRTNFARRAVILTSVIFQVASLGLMVCLSRNMLASAMGSYLSTNTYTSDSASGSSAPLGDVIQLLGSWAFGSPRAGWWFMCAESAMLLLTLLISARISLSNATILPTTFGGAIAIPRNLNRGSGTNAMRHGRMILRAGVVAFLAALGMIFLTIRDATVPSAIFAQHGTSEYSGSAIENFSRRIATSVPDVLSTLMLGAALAVIVVCGMMCLMYLWAVRAQPGRSRNGTFIPILGMLAAAVCIVSFAAGPFVIGSEFGWAFALCMIWGAAVAAALFRHRPA